MRQFVRALVDGDGLDVEVVDVDARRLARVLLLGVRQRPSACSLAIGRAAAPLGLLPRIAQGLGRRTRAAPDRRHGAALSRQPIAGCGACAVTSTITSALLLEPCDPPAWPAGLRVGANSPSRCPTMFSVTKTGMKSLPLWTCKVVPDHLRQ